MNDPGVGVVVTIVALICTLVLVTFQRWVVRKNASQAVRADMLHYQSDVMMNGAILIALGLAWYGWHRADALFALGIGIYILYSALRMGYEAVQSLLDRALPDSERNEIFSIVTSWPASAVHTIFERGSQGRPALFRFILKWKTTCHWFRLTLLLSRSSRRFCSVFLVQTSSFTRIPARLYPVMLGFRNSL